MTAYGYVFEIFDALYSGDAHEIATIHDRFFGIYAWSFWGAVLFNFLPLQAPVVALACGAIRCCCS